MDNRPDNRQGDVKVYVDSPTLLTIQKGIATNQLVGNNNKNDLNNDDNL
jgi:hypothetical protein